MCPGWSDQFIQTVSIGENVNLGKFKSEDASCVTLGHLSWGQINSCPSWCSGKRKLQIKLWPLTSWSSECLHCLTYTMNVQEEQRAEERIRKLHLEEFYSEVVKSNVICCLSIEVGQKSLAIGESVWNLPLTRRMKGWIFGYSSGERERDSFSQLNFDNKLFGCWWPRTRPRDRLLL